MSSLLFVEEKRMSRLLLAHAQLAVRKGTATRKWAEPKLSSKIPRKFPLMPLDIGTLREHTVRIRRSAKGKDMAGPVFRTYSLVPRGGPGLACDYEGLALGPITLAKKIGDAAGNRRYRLLSLEDVVQAFRLAYGPIPDAVIERRCRGVARVTQLLAGGADALARIHAVLIGFPQIPPDGMAKLVAAASLRKYNPDWENEPRVPAGNPDRGQWTGDGDGGGVQVAAVGDLKCQGFSGGCQSGGTYGTGAMYRIFGRNVCRDCAVKMMGLENESGAAQTKALAPYLIGR
jgi:hypothetical protein